MPLKCRQWVTVPVIRGGQPAALAAPWLVPVDKRNQMVEGIVCASSSKKGR